MEKFEGVRWMYMSTELAMLCVRDRERNNDF